MNFTKDKKMLASGAGIAILLIVCLVFLRGAWTKYDKAKQDLEGLTRQLTQLEKRDPFPSHENVAAEKTNLINTARALLEINEVIRAEQIEPQQMESAEFMLLLERTIETLNEKLKLAEITRPPGYLFGFDRYARDGVLPRDIHIPKLVQQLKIIEQICNILADTRISELQSIAREEFETRETATEQTPAGRGGRGQPAPTPRTGAQQIRAEDDGDLFSTPTRFTLTFKSRESAAFSVINKLASYPMFCVIKHVELANERQSVPRPDAKQPDVERTRREVVIGREMVVTKIELDVYRFAQIMNKIEQISIISPDDLMKNDEI